MVDMLSHALVLTHFNKTRIFFFAFDTLITFTKIILQKKVGHAQVSPSCGTYGPRAGKVITCQLSNGSCHAHIVLKSWLRATRLA